LKLLFWNLQGKKPLDEAAELIHEVDCDIAAFCECSDDFAADVQVQLNALYSKGYRHQETPGCNRIKVLVRDALNSISLLNQHKYFSLMLLKQGAQRLILAFVHMPSKLHSGEDELRSLCEKLTHQISAEEMANDVQDSLVIGDFNVNPFESPIISFSGLLATNSMDCVERDQWTRKGDTKRVFFNPMWSLYAQHLHQPGSHHYRRLTEDVIEWHFLDQVIIRASLISKFSLPDLRLVDSTTRFSFRKKSGKPFVSDHLPISCRLNLAGGI